MTTQLSNSAEPPLSSRIAAFLANPVVDKTIAVIACLPFLYVLYLKLQAGTLDVVRTNMVIQNLIIVATMLARRAPVRVTIILCSGSWPFLRPIGCFLQPVF